MAPKISIILGLLVAILTLGTWALALDYTQSFLARREFSQRDEIIRVRTEVAAESVARTLNDDWEALRFVASQIPSSSPERINGMVHALASDNARIIAANYVTASGFAEASSQPRLQGLNLGDRAWFARGLQGSFAGDVRDAVTLNTFLGGSPDNPARVIDLAVPVIQDGRSIGVASLHIRKDWLERYISDLEESLIIDLFLLSREGRVLHSSQDVPSAPDTLGSWRAAAIGEPAALRETWPDGQPYDVSVVPSVRWADLPDFGWRMVGRLAAEAPIGRQAASLHGLPWLLGLTALAVAVLLVMYGLVSRPLARLAAFADRLADGGSETAGYPPSEQLTAETAALSAALSRLDKT